MCDTRVLWFPKGRSWRTFVSATYPQYASIKRPFAAQIITDTTPTLLLFSAVGRTSNFRLRFNIGRPLNPRWRFFWDFRTLYYKKGLDRWTADVTRTFFLCFSVCRNVFVPFHCSFAVANIWFPRWPAMKRIRHVRDTNRTRRKNGILNPIMYRAFVDRKSKKREKFNTVKRSSRLCYTHYISFALSFI